MAYNSSQPQRERIRVPMLAPPPRRRDLRDSREGRHGQHSQSLLPPRPPPSRDRGNSYKGPTYDNHDTTEHRAHGDDGLRQSYDSYIPPRFSDDMYRPPQSDFTFDIGQPARVQDRSESMSLNNVRRQQNEQGNRLQTRFQQTSYPLSGSMASQRIEPAGKRMQRRERSAKQYQRNVGGRLPWRPFLPAERELLSANYSKAPERVFDAGVGMTYRPVDELSDSDEAEMDISEDEDDLSNGPVRKRARLALDQSVASNDNAPKWSNPDPYTAAPLATADTSSIQKRKDVVQLIRKARVQPSENHASAPAEAEEFISCDFDSDEDQNELNPVSETIQTASTGNSEAGTGPLLFELSHLRDRTDASDAATAAFVDTGSIEIAAASAVHSRVSGTNELRETPRPAARLVTKSQAPTIPPHRPQPRQRPTTADPAVSTLGSRKRTHDDVIKLPAHARLKKASKMPVQGSVVGDWKPHGREEPCPWLKDHSDSVNISVWLHKEIADFYDYVRPRGFEERIRGEVVRELKEFCRSAYGDAEVYPFGSFPSGLYLPTGDMDLVFVSDQFLNRRGPPKYDTKRALWKFRDLLLNHRLARFNEIEVVSRARVPLVKYIDAKTGLKMDISFENLAGLQAVKTFKYWKEQYRGMPVLVTLIKHFLHMRGLNEPVNGGIGGFSVICLVVSMLQMMPQVQSGNMDTQHHMGELFMEFLDLYGNRFNFETTAISLNPPKYVAKNKVASFAYRQYDRLSIIDPNNPANDIAGGSSNTRLVFNLFSEAHALLAERMAALGQSQDRRNVSILEVLFAGNYRTFREQRELLEKLARVNFASGSKDSLPVIW